MLMMKLLIRRWKDIFGKMFGIPVLKSVNKLSCFVSLVVYVSLLIFNLIMFETLRDIFLVFFFCSILCIFQIRWLRILFPGFIVRQRTYNTNIINWRPDGVAVLMTAFKTIWGIAGSKPAAEIYKKKK